MVNFVILKVKLPHITKQFACLKYIFHTSRCPQSSQDKQKEQNMSSGKQIALYCNVGELSLLFR